MNRRALAFVSLVSLGSCSRRDPTPATDAAVRVAPAAPQRPEFPAMGPDDEHAHDCFPRDFATTRARVRGDVLELCGLSAGLPRCYSVDPVTSFVRRIEVADAPRTPVAVPELIAPLARTELQTRGARIDARAGTLAVVSPSGASRPIEPRTIGISTLENGVMAPWNDGWFVAIFGIRRPDLGASALLEPGRIRMRGRAAFLACDGGT